MNYLNKYAITIIILLLLTGSVVSCRKILDINPPVDQLTSNKVFTNDNSAISVLLSIYNQLSVLSTVESNISPTMGIYADELTTTNSTRFNYLNNAVLPTDGTIQTLWSGFYSAIYTSNSLIDAMQSAKLVSDSAKTAITGEAKFLRAFCYLYLVNLWGEIPLITSTDAQTTSLAKRESVANVYGQIVSDLQEAQTSLPANFIYSDRVRANKIAATALLARAYLYLQKWPEAVAQSTQVIQPSSIVMLEPLNKVFIKNSNETILQFWRQNGFSNAGLFYIPSSGNIPGYPVTPFLISSFEANDQRKTAWITTTTQQGTVYSYPYKYKKRSANSGNDAEYAMTLRLAEQYLIRAEAHAMQNNLIEAIADLNRIRNRAGLAPLSSPLSQSQLLPIIEKERLTELFSEWGHRFFDLKRNGRLDLVLSSIKPQWKPFAVVLPVPQQEINKNPFLMQNTGY